MSDDPNGSPGPAPPPKSLGLPAAAFVKGGTTSSAHDRRIAEIEADAERRRQIQDREKIAASIPIEDGGAMLYTNHMTPNPQLLPMETAKVLLKYVNAKGEETGLECLADVMLGHDPNKPHELMLQLVCPKCKARGLPQGQAQISVRQSNRRWFLDQRKAGELIIFDDGGGKRPYRSAGVVMDMEKFTCPNCPWSATISENRVWTV